MRIGNYNLRWPLERRNDHTKPLGNMIILGAHYIDLPLRGDSGQGSAQRKDFNLENHSEILWITTNGDDLVALERPNFYIVRGNGQEGADYCLNFTINVKQNIHSLRNHRKMNIPILDLLLFDKNDNVLNYFTGFGAFEFWPGEDNVERWITKTSDTQREYREAHQAWCHSVRAHFDEIAKVRVSFLNQKAQYSDN
ncbi:MAG: hypothetical protein N4A65_11030 [Cohaesibacter sp.]|jgi:hypothetical protein|nr:hypothetical protein [Cohaesibacter sp.]